MNKFFISAPLLALCLISDLGHARAKQLALPQNLLNAFHKAGLESKFVLQPYTKPAFLEIDLNGDGIPEIAALVIEKKTGKKGIVLFDSRQQKAILFGAGSKFGNGSDNFQWMGGWQVSKHRFAYEALTNKEGNLMGSRKRKLLRPALYVYDLEDGVPNSGGLIYWSDKKYIWIQQGE